MTDPAAPHAAFWRSHVRLGVLSTTVCAGIGLTYALTTWSQPNRALLLTIGLMAILSGPVILSRPGMRIFTGRNRSNWLYGWSVLLLLAVFVTTVADGGAQSPLALLFGASLVFTASGFGRSGAVVLGIATVAAYVLAATIGWPGTWEAILMACALSIIAATCTMTSGRLLMSLKEQQRLTEQLRVQATHDGLTGCLNHSALVEHLELEVTRAHREGRSLGFVMMDLDDFKATNDTFGHVAADELLTALGAELARSVRAYDLVGRVGGDEFAIIVPDTEEPEVRQLADRVRRRLSAVGAPLGVALSVGVAVLQPHEDARMLRQRADEALYVAKRAVPAQPQP